MLKIKSAQLKFSVRDFTNVDVRRIFGAAYEFLQQQENKDAAHEQMQELMYQEDELKRANPYMSLQEFAVTPLWGQLQEMIGADNWVFNPYR